MSENLWVWRCDRVIPSKAGAGRSVLEEILQQLKEHDWGDHDIFSIHLAMEEALINAIKHGNRQDASKQVQFACRMAEDLIRIEIADEGEGFDPDSIPDPTDPTRLEAPCGRGLKLMRSFMSKVEFNDKGNQVVLEKERTKTD